MGRHNEVGERRGPIVQSSSESPGSAAAFNDCNTAFLEEGSSAHLEFEGGSLAARAAVVTNLDEDCGCLTGVSKDWLQVCFWAVGLVWLAELFLVSLVLVLLVGLMLA